MTEDRDDRIQLTRRQILGSASAVGLAGAGAGLGTSAFFSDEETFEGNTIAAGDLDLTVDWEEHYSYPQLYGFDDPTAGLEHDVLRSEPEESGDDFVGFPDPENPQVWIHEDDLEDYMANTAIEAFPDPDDDGQQEQRLPEQEFVYDPCEHGANLPVHLDPDGLRTDNEGTRGDQTPQPLVNLEDVKPGDFGEFTLSFHICGNPGYVWLRADNVSDAENGFTEPESSVDETSGQGELAENIQTAWWYDTDGNNVIDESVGAVDVMLAVDTSGSLDQSEVDSIQADANSLASDLDATGDARVGGLSFGNGSISNFTGLSGGPVQFSGLSAGGNTPMPAALDVAAAELDANGRAEAETFVVLFTDGGPNYENKFYSAGGHTVGGSYTGGTPGDSAVTNSELCETSEVADAIRQDHRILTVGIDDDRNPTGNSSPVDCDGDSIASLSQYLRDYIAGDPADYFQADDPGTVGSILDVILAAIAMPEQVFHRGTLAEDLALLESGAGIPLDGDLASDFDEIDDAPTSADRQCFQPGVTNYVGFAWWLPIEVGNEIQGDSVGFDLGFYAEQCRNNSGAGP